MVECFGEVLFTMQVLPLFSTCTSDVEVEVSNRATGSFVDVQGAVHACEMLKVFAVR